MVGTEASELVNLACLGSSGGAVNQGSDEDRLLAPIAHGHSMGAAWNRRAGTGDASSRYFGWRQVGDPKPV